MGGEEGVHSGGREEREEGCRQVTTGGPAAAGRRVQQDTWWLGPRSRPVFGWGVSRPAVDPS